MCKKLILKVNNVGQGDSYLLYPDMNCMFNELPFLVDCGPTKSKIIKKIGNTKVNLVLTHSHRDHIGGLNKSILKKSNKVFIPFYMPEVLSILVFLRKYLINFKTGIIDYSLLKGKLVLVGDGDKLCNHIEILNPPKSSTKIFKNDFESALNINNALNILGEIGIELPTDEILNYKSPIDGIVDFESDFIFSEDEIGFNKEFYLNNARQFVHEFFISLTERIIRNGSSNHDEIEFTMNSHYELTANKASIVFKYQHVFPNLVFLFTGDADKSVFYRLVNEKKSIKANVLKIPHHGSRNNIDEFIINEIDPDIAVISHNNGVFGRSKDAHPHNEVIDLLEYKKIDTHYTNDVIKGGKIIRSKTIGMIYSNLILFN